MSKDGLTETKNVAFLKKNHDKVREKLKSMPKEAQQAVKQGDDAFNEITSDVFDFESESRVRKAGYTPQQAEDIAYIVKSKGVGKMFNYKSKSLVFTPFKTVVDSQVYLDAVQNRLLELTSVPVEIEVSNLKKTIQEFTSLSFFGLIKLAFKRLLKGAKQ